MIPSWWHCWNGGGLWGSLVGGSTTLRVGFDSIEPCFTSDLLFLLPVCCWRCDLSASFYCSLLPRLPTMADSYTSETRSKWPLCSMRCFSHGIFSLQLKSNSNTTHSTKIHTDTISIIFIPFSKLILFPPPSEMFSDTEGVHAYAYSCVPVCLCKWVVWTSYLELSTQ